MSLSSALIKQVIEEKNLDTWSNLKKIYLPQEYQTVYGVIDKHVDKYFKLPTFEELRFEVRDENTLEKLSLIEKEEVETESFLLLDYLKGEFVQKEALSGLTKFVDESISFDNAEETLEGLYEVISSIEKKVDLQKSKDIIEKAELFDTDEELDASLRLGLNAEYDQKFIFGNTSLILIGGYRGSGKSIVCNNIAQSQVEQGKTVIKFTIEMQLREELQRQCAIATGIPHFKIRYKELTVDEWNKVARWWSSRYLNGEEIFEEVYLKNRDFTQMHVLLSKNELSQPAIDIVHTPELTVPKFKAETLKRLNKYDNVGLVIVDYMNKMSLSDSTHNKFEWIEQIQVADKLKSFAEQIGIPIVSPFQTKATGEVKYGKDILVPADAAYNLVAGPDYIEFENIKMRHMEEVGFISKMDWPTLRCGPETAIKSDEENEEPQDL